MAIDGLSKDIKSAVDDLIDNLEYNIDLEEIEPQELKKVVKGKVDSFNSGKSILQRWMDSPNAPQEKTIISYVRKFIRGGKGAMNMMRDALSKKFDYYSTEQSKHADIANAKPFILESIMNLNSAIVELESMIESDEINLSEKEFKIGYPERMARGEVIDTSRLHKDWYNKKEDAIKLCPEGTEGEILELQGLKVQLPKQPTRKKDILFSDKPVKEQYWRRTPLPKGCTQDNEEAYADYIKEEFKRRIYGVWFMNKGKPVYLTGHMYFWLQWYKDKDNGGYSSFRFAQCYMSYHTKACEVDTRCLGQFFVKSRRTGYTLEKLSKKLNQETITGNFTSGMTSKSETDVKAAFEKKQYAFGNLPFFFKPVVKGRDDSVNRIEFSKPSNATKKAKKDKQKDLDDYLNTLSDVRTTTAGAYDGVKLNDYLADEAMKWPTGKNFLEHWGIVSPTMDENGYIVGKGWVGSTVGDYKDGGWIASPFWKNSNPKERDEVTGRTFTGLYRYFLPIQDNSTIHTDKYGICHKDKPSTPVINVANGQYIKTGATRYYERVIATKRQQGQETLYNYLRNHPMSIDHALRSSNVNSSLNVERIQDQSDYLFGFQTHSGNNSKVIRGNLYRENGQEDGLVNFDPNENGKFKFAWLPPKELQNKRQRKRGQDGPGNEWLGVGGLDPYGTSKTADGRGSDGSIHFLGKENALYPSIANKFIMEYIYRPEDIEIFFEDALMAAEFLGMPIFHERDKNEIEGYFERKGKWEFLMDCPEQYMASSNKRKVQKGAASRSKLNLSIYYALQSYVNEYVGKDDTGEIQQNVLFEETLKDWKEFDPSDRTDYDASISSGFALVAAKAPVKKQKEQKVKLNRPPVRLYNIQGDRSVPKDD